MAQNPVLLDRFGKPVERPILKQEVAAPTFGSIRTPISGYPADGLNPVRLANILRAADQGDPIRYLELAETIEERDPHYIGVLGTRRRSVSQIDITVEAASDAPRDVEMADMVRDWLKRDELTEEMFDILDCIGKGYSFTEIIWDTSEGQWRPSRLEWRDPRWFRFDRRDLTTPIMLGDNGEELPLPPFKFIYSQIKAKSGLSLRSGLARIAAWGWMFKAFTQRDWAIFTQTFGQPLRVGKYGSGSSEAERDTLFTAVANIAGDCAAIIPDSMTIDFIESKTVGASSDLYEQRSDWFDKQISKAVLGQTSTTDAVIGGLGSGKEHRQVQEDIERADAIALAGILNRDLIRPWIDLEYGPQRIYPRLKLGRPEKEDLKLLSESLGTLVPLGLRVQMSEVRDRFGFADPAEGAEILGQSGSEPPPGADASSPTEQDGPIERSSAKIKRGPGKSGVVAPQSQQDAPAGEFAALSPAEEIALRLEADQQPEMEAMLGQIEAMIDAAGSLQELREMILTAFDSIDTTKLTTIIATALTAADLGGRAMAESEGD